MRILTFFCIVIFSQLSLIAADAKITVVDEQFLIDNYDKSVDLIKKLESRFKKEESKMKVLEEKIIAAKKDIMLAGSSRKETLLGQMRRFEVEYKVNKEYLTEMLSMKRNQYTKEVLQDIHKAIEKYSTDNNIDLVIRKNLPVNRGEQKQKFVFFNKEKMDITKDILNMINSQYKKNNK
jgi:Skp family chaperone for outer membrane proteins